MLYCESLTRGTKFLFLRFAQRGAAGSTVLNSKTSVLSIEQMFFMLQYKDRIYKLLREARLYNPSLPDFDG